MSVLSLLQETVHHEEKYLAELRPIITVPYGGVFFGWALSQAHFVPGYDCVVPPGQWLFFSGIRVSLMLEFSFGDSGLPGGKGVE